MNRFVYLLAALAFAASSASAATLIIEGPAERGEGILPAGGGTMKIDVYGGSIPAFSGMQLAFCFVDEYGYPSTDIKLRGGTTIVVNEELFSDGWVDREPTGRGASVVGMQDIDIAGKTWLMTLTFSYTAASAGAYRLVADPAYTMLIAASVAVEFSMNEVACRIDGQQTSKPRKWILGVSDHVSGWSSGFGVPVSGSAPGTANYLAFVDDAAVVSLTAPATFRAEYAFVRWRDDAGNTLSTALTYSFTMTADTAVIVEYAEKPKPATFTLTVRSEGVAGVAIAGNFGGTTDYSRQAEGGTAIVLTAPVCVGDYLLVRWKQADGTTITDNQACQFTLAADTTVIAEYKLSETPPRTLTVTSAGPPNVQIAGTPAGATPYSAGLSLGTMVDLTAPQSIDGRVFLRWKTPDNITLSTDPRCSFPLTADTTVVVEYTPLLIVKSTGATGVPISGTLPGTTNYAASVAAGTVVALTAPYEFNGLCFSGWTGGTVNGTTCTATISGDRTLTVSYQKLTHFYVSAPPAGKDSNRGTSNTQSMASIQALLDRYPHIGAGCTVHVGMGTIAETFVIGASHAGLSLEGSGQGYTILEPPAGSAEPCIYVQNCGTGAIASLTVQNAAGAGIVCENSSISIDDCRVYGNGAGGVVCRDSSPSITNCTISTNKARQGAGISCLGQSQPVIMMNYTICNEAEIAGGGIFCDPTAQAHVENNEIGANNAPLGAGIYLGNVPAGDGAAMAGRLTASAGSSLVNNVIFSNRATQGGGIFSNIAFTASESLIALNWADQGGAIYCDGAAPAIVNAIISGNTAEQGGGAFCIGDTASFTNITFTGNRAEESGGAVQCDSGSHASFVNCILWGDTARVGAEVSLAEPSIEAPAPAPDPSFTHCNVPRTAIALPEGTCIEWGAGNIDAEPQFIYSCRWDENGSPGAWADDRFLPGNYRLAPGSLCIDAGMAVSAGPIDAAGEQRVAGAAIDIGAFESQGVDLIFVDDDASSDPGPGDPAVSDPLANGSAAHPFDSIQKAINAAKDNQAIIVLDGTYSGTGNRDISLKGKKLVLRSQNGAAKCTVDCRATDGSAHRGFVFASGENDSAVLNGFTITNANNTGDATGNDLGGAIYCEESSPILIDNVLLQNHAGAGAGIFARDGMPVIVSNLIAQNTAYIGAGLWVGGESSNAVVVRNIIHHNTASHSGGGVCEYVGAVVTENTIADNSAAQNGGGIVLATDVQLTSDSTVLTLNRITGNSAASGGGIYCYYRGALVVNNILTGNSATNQGGAIYCDNGWPQFACNTIFRNAAGSQAGGIYLTEAFALLENCIFWGDTAASGAEIAVKTARTAATVRYCDVAGGRNGVLFDGAALINWDSGNVAADPAFADPNAGNYHLLPGSPCIDAGNNHLDLTTERDLSGVARVIDGNLDNAATIDIGAWEYLPGDLDYDGKINIIDLIRIRNNLGKDPTSSLEARRADMNGDGVVDLKDLMQASDLLKKVR